MSLRPVCIHINTSHLQRVVKAYLKFLKKNNKYVDDEHAVMSRAVKKQVLINQDTKELTTIMFLVFFYL